jgi:hypothetical protein
MNSHVPRPARTRVAVLAAIVALAGCSKSNPPPAGEGPAPDAALLAELGEPVEVGPYQIRVPKGYTETGRDNPDGSTFVSWQAPPPKPEFGHRFFTVMVFRAPDGQPEKTAAQMRTRPPASSGLIDYAESAPETVALGSEQFERVTTTCTAGKTGRKLRGFQYTRGGRPAVAIIYQGAAEDEQSFNLADAAARTLASRDGGK